nr:immunoglobulin heavy chain junction region [Mus musculus]NSM08980.1 immunoglobulin heavy chain junction region [Mus musculus]
CPWNLFAYW